MRKLTIATRRLGRDEAPQSRGTFREASFATVDEGSDDGQWPDPLLEGARQEANGVELSEDPFAGGALLAEHEEAQEVEVFIDPDAAIPAMALSEGRPGQQTFVGDQVGAGPDAENETRERADEQSWKA